MDLRPAVMTAFFGALTTSAPGATIFNTGPQAGEGLGICSAQSAAIRLTPARDCTLSSVSLWCMSSVPAGLDTAPVICVSLRADQGEAPGEQSIESWARPIAAVGQDAVLETFTSELRPVLHAGVSYWIVAQSAAPDGRSPVWNYSAAAMGTVAFRSGGWWAVTTGRALAAQVDADPVCSADYDHDGDPASDLDIAAFFACLGGSCCATCDPADINGDGEVSDADIEAFFRVLAGGPC